MDIAWIIAIYFVVWWLCLFMVLPFGIKSQAEGSTVVEGTEPGAPQRPMLIRKILITTVISAVVTALLFWGLSNPVIQEYWR
ncbi:MAG: DUF1467 family protein [Hyphomicrobiaceae bacterium]|nr:DUF1467 family protein [Hyphomicrobiaceae bacterium]